MKNEVVIPFEYTSLKFMSDVTLVAEKGFGKNIIIDFSNKRICKTEFEYIRGYSSYIDNDKLCSNNHLARKGQKYGFIDKFGNTKIDFKYEDGLNFCRVCDNNIYEKFYLVSIDGIHWGVIDQNDKLILPYEFDEGFFYIHNDVICARKDERYGIIDWNNNIVVDFIYDDLKSFNDGFACAKLGKKWGFIDKQGKVLNIRNI